MSKSFLKEREFMRRTCKGVYCITVLLSFIALLPVCADAQLSQTPNGAPDSTNSNSYAIIERGPNHRVWQSVVAQTNDSGEVTYQTNSYNELATGLEHLVDGQWVDSSDSIQITANGGVATNCQHQVAFAANINTSGAIDLTMPDGNHLRSQILGLSYLDPTTGQYVLIASLQDSTGQVVGTGSNQVIYADAFNGGFKADVSYSNSIGGFSQEILLREQPPSPESFGLNSTNTRLQVMTEFLNPPTAQVTQAMIPDGTKVDQLVNFATMQIIQGKAFSMGSGGANDVPVNKHWLLINSRQILVEDVPFPMVAAQLLNLPAPSSGSSTNKGANADGLLHRVMAQIQLPSAPKPARVSAETMKVAVLPAANKGFLMDYTAVISQDSYTFKCDTTYYISAPVVLTGTNTFEGGTVIKFSTNGGLNLQRNANPGQINWLAGPYRPVIFTAVDDNSVGQTIGTNTPSGYYANPALEMTGLSGNLTLAYFRIAFAQQAIVLNGNASAPAFYHGQIVNCQNGMTATGNSEILRNVLFASVVTGFNNVAYGSVDAQSSTFSGSTYLASFSGPSGTVSLTNCILANITDLWLSPTNTFTISGNYNGFYSCSSTFGSGTVTTTNPFQTVGAGSYYGTVFTNGGTTSLDARLLADLQQKTIYPPLFLTNQTIAYSTNLFPQALRDTNSSPALGYHYDPIDYLVDNFAITNAALTVTNGAAIASYNEKGIQLLDGSSIVSIGSPLYPNWFVRYNSVQERAVVLGGTNLTSGLTISALHYGTVGPTGQYRFSKFACPAGGGNIFNDTGTNSYSSLQLQDCELWSGPDDFSGNTNSVTTLRNNLFDRSSIAANTSAATSLWMSNNLILATTVFFWNQATTNTWQAFNNAFDSCSITTNAAIPLMGKMTNGYNAYLNCTNRLNPIGSSDIVTNVTLGYQNGLLGSFYQPTNSALIDKGSTTADLVGLYHYTTQTNQVKETNSPVDIGYHYVALGTNGLPIDTDGDGIPDYFADANGNGLYDTGDSTNWRTVMVVAWGDNSSGQCNVPTGLTDVIALSGGLDFSMALLRNGTVVPWGSNAHNQTNVPGGLTNVMAIASGPYHTLALKTNGTVQAWGTWQYTNAYYTATVPTNLTNVIAVAASIDHDLALKSDGTVVVWSYNTNDVWDFVPTNLPAANGIAAAYNHNVALLTNGAVTAWGFDGSLFGWHLTEVPADLTNANAATAVSAWALHSLALRSNTTVEGWGYDSLGQTDVPSGLSNVVAIATGFQYSLALKNNGTVSAWGYFDHVGSAFVPQGEQTGSIIGIGSGGNHCMVIRSKPFAPFILTEPASQAKPLGGTVTFTVTWAALASMGFQWQLNGTNIPGATSSNYTITGLQPAQFGTYAVVLSNSSGSITSSNAVLTTNGAIVSIPGGLWLWGKNDSGQAVLPTLLTNLSAVAGGVAHNVAVKEDSTVIGWGDNTYNQTNPPTGLTNVVLVAAGAYHNLALKSDGSVVPWGRDDFSQTNLPSDIVSNAIAVSASGNQSLALLNDGSVRQWGQTNMAVPSAVTGVTAIATGTNFNLALLGNGTVVPWGVNNFGQTNVPTGLVNVVAIAAGTHHCLALKSDGTVVSWGDNTYGQTNVPPALTNSATANVISIAAGNAHSMALRNDGTVIAWGDNSYGQTNSITNLTGVKAIAAGAYHSIALEFSPRIQYYPLDVKKDLLLIFNTNSMDSSNVMRYYLNNRPMIANANVLGIGFPGFFVSNAPASDSHVGLTNTTVYETISPADYTNYIFTPIINWLAANTTKRPAYVILFLDVPSRISICATNSSNFPFYCVDGTTNASVSYQLATGVAGWQPFITHINMNGTNDCKAYIDKLAYIGTNYSPGKLVISARNGIYGNTNYYFDDTRFGFGSPLPSEGSFAKSGVLSVDPSASITYTNEVDITNLTVHITTGSNVAGYLSWGAHSSLAQNYATNGFVHWTGSSRWWVIQTIESFNGQRFEADQGRFVQWFSPNAFGSTNYDYTNTPVAAVSNVGEQSFGYDSTTFFELWSGGKNFGICALNALTTAGYGKNYYQAVGDPLISK